MFVVFIKVWLVFLSDFFREENMFENEGSSALKSEDFFELVEYDRLEEKEIYECQCLCGMSSGGGGGSS